MHSSVDRRSFLGTLLGAPMLVSGWKNRAPADYLADLKTWMRAAPVPGAVIGTVRDFKPGWIAPLGVQVAGAAGPVTPSTLFQAASLTKQITAYAAFALRGQGKLDFDRPLVSYLDDLRHPQARTVTARHVLSHSSGFPNWRFAKASDPAPELEPAFAPGTRYQYSGEGYFYLQRVMEQLTGQGFGRMVQQLVFRPLGLASSSLVWDPETLHRTAAPHDRRGELRKGWENPARALREYAASIGQAVEDLRYGDLAAAARKAGNPALPNWMSPNAASSLVTSAEDYARFVAAAIRNPELTGQQTTINESLGWGLGWAIERAAGRTYLWQWGDNPGFKNFVLAEPKTGQAIFVFCNGDSGARVYDRVITRATGHEHPAFWWL